LPVREKKRSFPRLIENNVVGMKIERRKCRCFFFRSRADPEEKGWRRRENGANVHRASGKKGSQFAAQGRFPAFPWVVGVKEDDSRKKGGEKKKNVSCPGGWRCLALRRKMALKAERGRARGPTWKKRRKKRKNALFLHLKENGTYLKFHRT